MATIVIQGVNDRATLLTKYTEAQTAYHTLAIGEQLIEGRHSVEAMRFSQTSLTQLASYIASLAAQLAALGVAVPGGRIRARNVYHS